MMARKGTGGDPEKELREAFKVFDRDGTGTISRDELKAVMKSLGENLTEDEIDEMLKLADKDGDGTIDCECSPTPETKPYMLSPHQTASLPRLWHTSREKISLEAFRNLICMVNQKDQAKTIIFILDALNNLTPCGRTRRPAWTRKLPACSLLCHRRRSTTCRVKTVSWPA